MKHKTMAAALAVLAAALLAVYLYDASYSVKADGSNFPEEARTWLSRGLSHPTAFQVTPCALLDLGSTRLVLAELDDGSDPGPQLGLFRLEKGWNGQYKIASSGYGGGSLWEQTVQDGNRSYYVLGGRNRLYGIQEASFIMEKDDGWEKSYSMSIPEGDYFLTAIEIDPSARGRKPGSLRLYNGAGEEVS